MNKPPADPIERLSAAILASSKYRGLAPALVRRVVCREWELRANLKETDQAARRKLHQVAGAYWPQEPHYTRWLAALRQAVPGGEQAVKDACRGILAGHASTRERLPILDTLYHECLADLGPLRSVLDVACGLNPLTSPWMPLAPGARYLACDVYSSLAEFLESALHVLGLDGVGLTLDVLSELPAEPVQVALLMKALPCLEQLDAPAAQALLERLPAEHLLISFPARSLGGSAKGMPVNYEAHMNALLAGKSWRVRRYLWPSELVFRLDRG